MKIDELTVKELVGGDELPVEQTIHFEACRQRVV